MSVSLMGFDFPMNMRLWKIAAVLKLANVSYSFVPLEYGADNETEEYMANCSPMGRTPTLQTEDGYIFESNAILRHIARIEKSNAGLYGRTTFEAAQVDMWLDYCSEFNTAGGHFIHTGAFGAPTTEEETKKYQEEACAAFAGLEKWLETRTFLAGERITIADVAIATQVDGIFRFCSDAFFNDITRKFKNSFRHYNTAMNHPKVVEALVAQKALIGLPPRGKAAKAVTAAAPKEKKEKKVEEKGAHNDKIVEMIDNFDKFSAVVIKKAQMKHVVHATIVETLKVISAEHTSTEVRVMLSDDIKCDPLYKAYGVIAKTAEGDVKARNEVISLVEKFAYAGCKAPQVGPSKAVDHPKATVDLIANFEKFAFEQPLTFLKKEFITAALAEVSAEYVPAEIACMLTTEYDCDEFLEKYTTSAETPGADGLKVRNELCLIVEKFGESQSM